VTTETAVMERPGTDSPLRERPCPEEGPRLVSLVAPAPAADPVRVFEEARRQGWDAVLWYLPSRRVALVGVGAVATLAAAGEDRFAGVAGQWRAMAGNALCFRTEEVPAAEPEAVDPAPGPILMGGFAFAAGDHQGIWKAFGDARFWFPRWVYQVDGQRAWVHVQAHTGGEPAAARRMVEGELAACRERLAAAWATGAGVPPAPAPEQKEAGEPGRAGRVTRRDVPEKVQWLAAVEEVVAAIRAGRLEKAVLARTVQAHAPGGFVPETALRFLREHYRDCYVFAVARGGACFLGATPERLVRLQGGQVEVACLAGSIARGRTEGEDARLGDELLSSAKNRHEHLVVLEAIKSGLAPLCRELTAAEEPVLLKFANVQHLYTPVRAHAAAGVSIFELAERLHPTPAMGGHPKNEALHLIRRLESCDRGWYAGPIGWIDGKGEGEFAVAIRSALVDGEDAWLYAGCGIVADSDPESEYEESCLKLRPMLAALGANGR